MAPGLSWRATGRCGRPQTYPPDGRPIGSAGGHGWSPGDGPGSTMRPGDSPPSIMGAGHTPGRGWVWVPGAVVARPVYAPALVVFVGGNSWSPAAGDGIGWFPLGPHEPYVPPYTASPGYAQRINATHVTNFQSGPSYDVTRATYVNRNVPQAVTVVHRDDFVQSRRTSGALIAVPFAEVGRAPVMGMTAIVVPQRESVIVQAAPQTRVVRPPENVASRSVYSRRAPPPAPVPFAARQQAFIANPGRPLSPGELAALQKNRAGNQPPVTVVNPGSVNRVENPGAYRDGQQPPERNAPAPGGTMVAPPARNAPAPGGTMTPAPARNAPAPGGDHDAACKERASTRRDCRLRRLQGTRLLVLRPTGFSRMTGPRKLAMVNRA